MFKAFKIASLYTLKFLGVFWLAGKLNKGNTCVLCYHGFAYQDEYKFRPKLFMRPETFAKRMRWINNSCYKVVSLQEAVKGNSQNENSVVLTMDDGWAGTIELVGHTLAHYKFPLMLYVTSYYAEKQIAVINVALSYIFWKTESVSLFIDNQSLSINKSYQLTPENSVDIVNELSTQIDLLQDIKQRSDVLEKIAKQLNVDLMIDGNLLFRLLNAQKLSKLVDFNVDLQLHTHRHCSPQTEKEFKSEITENMTSLEQIPGIKKLDQFCYPSGEYYSHQLPWLSDVGVKTATTIFSGMLTKKTDLLQIPRFLDGEDVHQIEFEAELCGFTTFNRSFL